MHENGAVQEHWQKLILCLAVLLIVVSSTVGADHLLGPLLWSPEGKCILALVYTLLFAGFGCGLMRWGARGAGRMVLLATLIVVPLNLALAGELRLLLHPTALRLLVLGLSAAALLILSGVILATVDNRRARFVTLAYFALSAFNAIVGPGVALAWGLPAFILPAWVFLGAVWKLNTDVGVETSRTGPGSLYFALGLLAYAFLLSTLRTGIGVLHLTAALYAVPVMLTGIAAARTAHSLRRFDPAPQGASLLRFAAQLLAVAAFALALARPPGMSPLFSGNTLAAALLGLGLFAASLRIYQQPAYLYLAFAALFVAYFGAGYFIADLTAAIEDTARRALGYPHRLPLPFKSLNGLAFNSLLALLSVQFARRWKDARLARHCHWIGLPLSLAACAFSCFEPKAAVLCLSGYSALFAVGVGLFEQPLLTYLACWAFVGAAAFAAALRPGLTLGSLALGAAGIGVGFWVVCSALAWRRVSELYRAPLVHASLAMSAIAVGAAALSAAPPQSVSFSATLTFFVVAGLSLLLGITYPCSALASLAVITANVGCGLAVVYADRKLHLGLSAGQFGIAASGAGVALRLAARWLGRIGERRGAAHGRASRVTLYLLPLFNLALVQAGLGAALAALGWSAHPLAAAALALTAVTLAASTRLYPAALLAHLAIGSALGVWLALFQTVGAADTHRPAVYGVVVAAFALALLALGEWARRWGEEGELRNALPDFACAALLAAVVLAVSGGANGLHLVLTLALASLGMMWLTRFRREPGTRLRVLVYLSLTAAAAGVLCFSGWYQDWTDPGAGTAWLALTMAVLSPALWSIGRLCGRTGRGSFYDAPCFHMSLLLAGGVFALVATACLASPGAFSPSASALCVNAATLLLLTKVWPEEWLTYGAATALVAAGQLALASAGATVLPSTGAHAILAAASAIGLWLAGFGCRNRPAGESGAIYVRPLFVSSLAVSVLAVPLALSSPLALLLLGVAFLLMVKSFPSAGWLYAVIASAAGAAYVAYMAGPPDDRWVEAALGAAFALWSLGVLVQRVKPALCARLQLRELGYEFPLFNVALAAAAIAVILRLGATLVRGDAWTAHPALLPVLAVFSLLMLKAYPRRVWVHLSIALLTAWCAIESLPLLRVFPGTAGAGAWLLAGITVAHLWWTVARRLECVEAPLGRRLGIRGVGGAGMVRDWSLGLFTVTASVSSVIVILTSWVTVFAPPSLFTVTTREMWWAVLMTLILAGFYPIHRLPDLGAGRLLIGSHAVLLLLVLWIGVPSSPLMALMGITASVYYPLATGGAGLATLWIGDRLASEAAGRNVWPLGYLARSEAAQAAAWAWPEGIALTTAALAFTRGALDLVTVVTLLLAAGSFTLLAASRRRVGYVYAGSALFAAACLYAPLAVSATQRTQAFSALTTWAAFAAVLAAFSLLAVAAWLQKEQTAPEAPAVAPERPPRVPVV